MNLVLTFSVKQIWRSVNHKKYIFHIKNKNNLSPALNLEHPILKQIKTN